MKPSNFFAMLSRMKYITRWGLMRNTREENLAEHSLETAMIAHALAVIHNRRLGGQIDVNRVAVTAMYHDISEILTGDLPTPVKYYNPAINRSYKELERLSGEKLLSMLPQDLRADFTAVALPDESDEICLKLVKYADKLSAYIKCIEEEKAGNREFTNAKESIYQAVTGFHAPEVDIFLEEFLPGYYQTVDENTTL
ncbi:5'-deoxynucleotidase [Candidatus Soleaferrea massiliensis]|uniref:5'-deoxynucleotidase n=1 Tax=Candidatus Soleaferrea massiliensis TaxID=1470354 RepID=UPI00058D308B|nr:5'-deoxynucleotidase [Candidatus Soleaferrea massiliensis]